MRYKLSILRALVRLSRQRACVDLDALVLRAGGTSAGARAALAELEREGLALRAARGPRPTLAGLALALAALPASAPAKPRARGMLRRHAA